MEPTQRGVWAERALFALVFLLVPLCLRQALVAAPEEAVMGAVQRIFYFHVPSAFAAFAGILLCALFSAAYLGTRDRRYDILAAGAAELGLAFCTIVLVTGPIWARPVWGVWWTGEVRLTSTLVLWLIYAGYLVLRSSAENADQAARWGAVIGIVGALDLPIIYKSVEWWRGLHPKVLKISGGQGLAPGMQRAFALCCVTFLLLFALLFIQRYRLGLLQEEFERLAAARKKRVPFDPPRSR